MAHGASDGSASPTDKPWSRAARWSEVTGWAAPAAVAVAVRLTFIVFNEMDAGDWAHRTARARAFVEHGAGFWAREPWPEGNYLLPALPMLLGGDAYWSVRVFSALIASLAVPLIYLLGRRIGGRRAGIVAAWILALLPYHIYISANGAMTEGPFLVFVLGASLAGSIWFERPRERRWLIYSGLCVLGAELFRFDGVFVGGSIGLLALLARDDGSYAVRQPRLLRTIALYAAIALAYPVALLVAWRFMYGDALYMIKVAQAHPLQYLVSGDHPRWPRWFYVAYSAAFWPLLGPAFALTPGIWLTSIWGAWTARRRVQTWFVALPIAVLTLFYLRAVLAHTLLNQLRYITALAIPLLAFVALPFRELSATRRRLLAAACVAAALATQALAFDAAWHDRGVISRQLGPHALIRPHQHTARSVVKWIDQHVPPGQRVVFTPHAHSTWLALAISADRADISRLTIYRTPNLVYDRSGMVNALRDSVATAQWVVTSGRRNMQGLRDGLVAELVQPVPADQSGCLQWNGIHMRLRADFGAMRVFEIVRTARRGLLPKEPGCIPDSAASVELPVSRPRHSSVLENAGFV
jgi:hypothetical protein